MAEIKNVSARRDEGCFDLGHPTQREARISVGFTIDDTIYSLSAIVEIDGEFDHEPTCIIATVHMIERYFRRFIYRSRAEDDSKALAVFRDHQDEISKAYSLAQAVKWQKIAASNYALARSYLEDATL